MKSLAKRRGIGLLFLALVCSAWRLRGPRGKTIHEALGKQKHEVKSKNEGEHESENPTRTPTGRRIDVYLFHYLLGASYASKSPQRSPHNGAPSNSHGRVPGSVAKNSSSPSRRARTTSSCAWGWVRALPNETPDSSHCGAPGSSHAGAPGSKHGWDRVGRGNDLGRQWCRKNYPK